MTGNRLLSPATSVLNILEEYHKDAEERLKSYGLGDDTRSEIVTDIYAKDDIYFSLNRSYEHIDTRFRDFCIERKLHVSLHDLLPRLCLYRHQAQAIDSILSEQTTIISTGTGSGKTESFLIPILHHCLEQKSHSIGGVKVVILYPMNALANDQIRRILEIVEGTGIRVGCFIGSTPQIAERVPGDQHEKCISRQEMIVDPPDILITNYVMLDRLITKPETRSMFVCSKQSLKYIVVDEVHYFRGTKGANLSLLLRRLRTLCERPLVHIGLSGTLRRSGGYYPDSKTGSIKQFARLIFGYEAIRNGIQLIEPTFKEFESGSQLEPLPTTDVIDGDSFLAVLGISEAEKLYEQLSGKALEKSRARFNEQHPMYFFATHSPFIAIMREKLKGTACAFTELVEFFRQLYSDTHHKEPHNPKAVVEAYWSLINYLNSRCSEKGMPLILDYRVHLILGNIGDSLTRCLLCKRYHDGRCPRCRYCGNGLLFKVSKANPDLCIAYLAGRELFPTVPSGRHNFNVMVQLSPKQRPSPDISHLRFALEQNLDAATNEESYFLRPASDEDEGVLVLLPHNKEEIEGLLLSEPRLYWHNVLKVTDALVVRPKTKTSNKLLGFVDNRERASSIKLRLNDEIAERTVKAWAASKWSGLGSMNLIEAFEKLQREVAAVISQEEEEENPAAGLLSEMPFWFTRMLTYIDEYKNFWEFSVEGSLYLQPDERELLNEIMLHEGAIDRTNFEIDKTTLQHFHLEKYRVNTQYGVGMTSTNERGYNIISLNEQGRLYKEFIARVKITNIKKMLDNLTARGILVQKITPGSASFYQLCPEYVLIEASWIVTGQCEWENNFVTVECHTADHRHEDRTEIEARFSDSKIQALICTPTLEMGVDIGKLSSVLMIGFPPSPANYAQRAGRAGRSDKSRLATVVTLSSPEDGHDEYYYLVPKKIIDGAITPPQFTLTNFALLAAHVYAYFSAGVRSLSLLSNPIKLQERINDFIGRDELSLRNELGGDYARFAEFLKEGCHRLPARLKNGGCTSMEDCYREGIFPDYGFRRDGLRLVQRSTMSQRKEDEEEFLTSREPEAAVRKLVPGRIVFCGGRAVKVDTNQPDETYETQSDPAGHEFRLYSYVVADESGVVQVDKKRDPDSLYNLSRFLDVREPLNELKQQGPLYCRVHLVHQGVLFFINEGIREGEGGFQPLRDHRGDYRFGTYLERDGLLIRFADQILPPNMKANFLAALLRGIPDHFDLDDSELRVAQNLRLYPIVEHESSRSSFFIYGHDESGLVPFKHVFEHLEDALRNALRALETCVCGGAGCYLCLFSLNSRSLTGRISSQEAMNCLSVYLRKSLLKPHIAPAKRVITQADVILHVSLSGIQCRIVVEDTSTGKREEHVRRNTEEDQNTRVYIALREALEQERKNGARTVRIRCNVDYIYKQLQGENDVGNGREAFLNMWLTLLNWQAWEIERV